MSPEESDGSLRSKRSTILKMISRWPLEHAVRRASHPFRSASERSAPRERRRSKRGTFPVQQEIKRGVRLWASLQLMLTPRERRYVTVLRWPMQHASVKTASDSAVEGEHDEGGSLWRPK